MIRKIILFGLLIVMNNFSFSQTSVYKPFPESFAVWKVSGSHNIGPFSSAYYSYQKYFADGDIIVNSVSYKKVKYYNYPGGNPYQSPGSPIVAFAYRNDSVNKKVYYLNVTAPNAVEQLWYDFNLNVGDTLKNTFAFTNPAWANNSNQRRIVSSIDSVAFCGIYYKRFNFNCAGGFNTRLIEGVGFEDNFTQTAFGDCPFEPHTIYSTLFSTCDPTAIQKFYDKKNALKVFPNPANSSLKVNSDFPLNNYAIYDNLGDLVTSQNILEDKVIDVSKISNGLYILKVEDEKGNPFYSKFIKE
ncbi:MAG: T9SS type A sorting domain-containing protein [Bacteroidetes bacterium]|nr:T9SS type A sorting domain-containing protein [Bacteroidota bacterium]